MISEIRSTAAQKLRNEDSGFHKFVWLHSAAPIAVSGLLVVLTLLSNRIAPEGGLSNMETHTMITTTLTLLQLAASVAVLFWDAGLNHLTLAFLRGRPIGVASLTKGFSKIGPILGSWIFRWSSYLLRMMVAGTLSSILMMLVPIPTSMYQEFSEFAASPALPLPDSVLIVMGIYLVTYLMVLAVILMPVVYRHRLTTYCIMDDQPTGGLRAVMQSSLLMRGNRRKLLKLDLRFWWFYLGEAGVLALSMGSLYISDIAAGSWLFPLLALIFQLGLYLIAKPKMALCYGLFYEQILSAQAEAIEEQPQ